MEAYVVWLRWGDELCVHFSRCLWQQNCVWDAGHWLAVAPNLPQRNAEENSSEHTGRVLPERVCCPPRSLLRPLQLLEAWAKGHNDLSHTHTKKSHPLCPPLLWHVMFRITGHKSGTHLTCIKLFHKHVCYRLMFYDPQRLFQCPPLMCYTCLCVLYHVDRMCNCALLCCFTVLFWRCILSCSSFFFFLFRIISLSAA